MRRVLAVAVISVALIGACGENQTLVAARHSAYNADRGLLMDEIVAYLHEHDFHDHGIGRAGPGDDFEIDNQMGTISTAWHLVSSNASTAKNDTSPKLVQGNYIRFDISVVDGPPWRVHVVSHAGRMIEGGRLMSEVAPDDGEMVLETNRVIADIHRRLERYAVRVDN